MRSQYNRSLHALLLMGPALLAVAPALAADVTPERLVNADREPQNWLMNHRTYDAQRYSPLDKINKGNVKDLRLAYAVAVGGTSANENLESTPLAEPCERPHQEAQQNSKRSRAVPFREDQSRTRDEIPKNRLAMRSLSAQEI